MSTILMRIAAIAAILTPIISGADAQTINWQYHTINPAKFWLTANQMKFAEEVNEATNGQLNLTVFPAGSSGYKGNEVLDAVSDNLLQMAEVWGGHVAGQEQVMEIGDLPQFVPGDLEFRKKLWAALLPEFSKYLESRYNVIVFDYMQINPRRLYTKKPVTKLADLQGMKIRALGLADSQFVEALGGEGTTTNWTELYTALQQGVLDGYMAADGATFAMKFYEVTDYIFDTQNAGPSFFLLINRDAYEELPDDIRATLMAKRESLRQANVKSYMGSDPWARKQLLEKGMTVNAVSEADEKRMREVGREIVSGWAKKLNPAAQEIYAVARSMIDAYYANK